MKRKSAALSAFFSLRLVLALFLCAAACSIATRTLPAFLAGDALARLSQRTLTFPERVAYQRAIEDVYWRHRIWPKERPDPKPPLDAVMSRAQLKNKVADYLRKSRALEDNWQRPITAEQLQSEMDRMANHTRQPDVLRELFAALDNDPFVIAECLARPALAERLSSNGYAYDEGIYGALKQRVEADLLAHPRTWRAQEASRTESGTVAPGAHFSLHAISSTVGGCIDDSWTATSMTNAPTARYSHTAVWTGSEMIIWGGQDSSFANVNTGARYNAAIDSWVPTSTANAPSGRRFHTAVWTGQEMIIWGGEDSTVVRTNTGGKYNPATNSWTATTTTNAPAARDSHTAVWTGSEMIIWGGTGSTLFNTGGRYNPSTNSWTATSTTNAPSVRLHHTAVWVGNEMIIWGGAVNNVLGSGGAYNPVTNSWRVVSTTNAPAARQGHTAISTDNEMIVWGGIDDNNVGLKTGGKWNPGTNTWTATSTTNSPTGRDSHTAVWTGSEMIVWGGLRTVCGYLPLNTGGRYDPSTDNWVTTATSNAPIARYDHTAVWTGNEMIVWGGFLDPEGNLLTDTGGRYCAPFIPPATPTPTATVTPSPTATPVPITVTNINDSGPGSLRDALATANDGETINFAVSGTITLTSGELPVNHSITIAGPGVSELTISGNAISRVFHIGFGTTVTISDLTITHGHVPFGEKGGCIYSDNAVLTIVRCTISSSYGGSGGAIYSDGTCEGNATLDISDSRLVNNTAADGGAIFSNGYGGNAVLHLNNTTVANNATQLPGNGAGIYSVGSQGNAAAEINNSAISNNSGALYGGGIYNNGSTGNALLRLTNSTVSNNSAGGVGVGGGGGIYNDGSYGNATAEVSDSTLSGNSSQFLGGALYNYGSSGTATMEVYNTILNTGAPGENIRNQSGTFTSHGYNLSNDDAGGYLNGAGDQINTDPLLGALQDNGGLTFTHVLLTGSPAIDSGDPNFTPPPFYDQRGPGFDRVVNGRIDKGSFEVQAGNTPTPTATTTPSPTATMTPTATATPTVTPSPSSTARITPTPRTRPTARSRPTPPPHLTPPPPPSTTTPTAAPRPTPPPHITPVPPPPSPRPTPWPRPSP